MRGGVLLCLALLSGGCNRDTALPGILPDMAVSVSRCDTGGVCSLDFTPPPDPLERDSGLSRGAAGALRVDTSPGALPHLWVPMYAALHNGGGTDGVGTIAKLDTRLRREVARYATVTCHSLGAGSAQGACDGQNGCCANDDPMRFSARQSMRDPPPHSQVPILHGEPSRTAIDRNGDLWVVNYGFAGFDDPPSVTKIGNHPGACIDRNGNGRIDTSSDTNGDGAIDVDCNDDGRPDDFASVDQTPCKNNLRQEFFGLDDECVLFTVNLPPAGRPFFSIGLVPVEAGAAPEDAWVGGASSQRLYRINGASGLIQKELVLNPGCAPGGLSIDAAGVGWTVGGIHLCWFDAIGGSDSGVVRDPSFGVTTLTGTAFDRQSSLWFGRFLGTAAVRYRPDRGRGFDGLASGEWTRIDDVGAAAGASSNTYETASDGRGLVWIAREDDWVMRLDPAAYSQSPGKDVITDGSHLPAIKVAGKNLLGVAVDVDEDVWSIDATGVVTHIAVSPQGDPSVPDLTTQPGPGSACPAGDRCVLQNRLTGSIYAEPYSSLTPHGLTNVSGSYFYTVQPPCAGTEWKALSWSADVPTGTTLTVSIRSSAGGQQWPAWKQLPQPGPVDLTPWVQPGSTIQIRFDLTTDGRTATPVLRGYSLSYRCP